MHVYFAVAFVWIVSGVHSVDEHDEFGLIRRPPAHTPNEHHDRSIELFGEQTSTQQTVETNENGHEGIEAITKESEDDKSIELTKRGAITEPSSIELSEDSKPTITTTTLAYEILGSEERSQLFEDYW